MKSKLKKILILFIGLVIAFSLNNTLINNKGEQTELNIPKQSAGYSVPFIHVDGNWTLTASTYDWCYGSGTWQEPYVIENVTIDASTSPIGSGILINNSQNAYFIVRNCTITNANGASGLINYAGGIKLINCSNGVINNNTCSNGATYGCGILVYDGSFNITISENTVQNNGRYGILAADSSYNLSITCNNVTYTSYQGIYLYNGCINNTIRNNIATNNGDYGIYLNNGCHNNTILGNNASGNQNGIHLDSCDNNTIQGNTVNDNNKGIYLNKGDYNYITGNTLNENNERGIFFVSFSKWNKITKNTINDNRLIGISLNFYCDNNTIENNTINRNDLGIALDQSNYNNISGNTLLDNNWCIYEIYSEGNIIDNNDCSSPTVHVPIFIDDAAIGVGAHNWTWAVSQSWCTGSGTGLDPYVIENLIISAFGYEDGIEIWNSNVSFIIQNCLIYNSDIGISLEYVNNSRLINNNCSNMYTGIYIEYSNNNTLSGNTANGNDGVGIYLYEGDYNYITGNTVNDNDNYGIYLDESCDNNFIGGNTANDNEIAGIYLTDSDYNNITGNTAGNNSIGIRLMENSDNNTISGNTLNDNDNYGMYLNECNNNTISGNVANGNGDTWGIGIHLNGQCSNNFISGNTANDNADSGIYFDGNDDHNTISGNTACNNTVSGIYLESANNNNNTISGNTLSDNLIGIFIYENSNENTIYENFFLRNGQHAVDNGSDNKWNSTTIGNYWDNWTSPDTTPQDGIVDVEYTFIGGAAGSVDYLPIAEDGAPSITINSPSDDDVSGSNAPNYDVTITDDYLFKMWYTLDGGLHNYTFTANGTIDQTAWDALSDGPITITFYATDIPGNIGSADVTITKGISPGGDDPTIVIVIVVVSIVGGVAVLAGVYIFMKKRAVTE